MKLRIALDKRFLPPKIHIQWCPSLCSLYAVKNAMMADITARLSTARYKRLHSPVLIGQFIKIICSSVFSQYISILKTPQRTPRSQIDLTSAVQFDNTLTGSTLCLKYPQIIKVAQEQTGEIDAMTFLKHHLLRSTTTARRDQPARLKKSHHTTPTVLHCTLNHKTQYLYFP